MFVNLGDARMFFDTVGSQLKPCGNQMVERPVLIALHGGPGFDHSPMRPYFDRFADTHQVLYLDLRGNGRSGGEPETWTLKRWGQDIKQVCDYLGIERPVVLGVSFGGMVAMSYAIQFPQHPCKLILSSTAAKLNLTATYSMMEKMGGPRARNVAERVFVEADERAMAEYLEVCLPLYNTTADPAAVESRARALVRTDVARHFFLGEMRTMDMLPNLHRIACPTLVMAGRHDPITPVECGVEIAGAIADELVELKVFEQAGHGAHRDEPELCAKEIGNFINRQ